MSELTHFDPNVATEETFDIRHYIYLVWHWMWLILLIAILAGVVSYFVSRQLTPVYASSTTLLVSDAPSNKNNPNYDSIVASQSLAKTYSAMMTSKSVIQEVAKQLGLVIKVEDFSKKIKVTPVLNTQLIDITVEDPDPILAASIANTLVDVFTKRLQTLQSSRFASSKDNLQTQLTLVEKQIQDVASQKTNTINQTELDRLDTQLIQYHQIYATVLNDFEQARLSEIQSSSNVLQINSAEPATIPTKPNILLNTIVVTLLSVLLVLGGILAQDAFDDTIKTPEDVSNKLKLPVLGVIFNHKTKGQPVITFAEPRSPISESFRSLRTNIQYANVDEPMRTLMVTSPSPGEGKTTVSSNLAVVFAQNGKVVFFADADLRSPSVHKKLEISNNIGLSQLVLNPELPLKGVVQDGKVAGLKVITCGDLPPNPAELLGSKKMGRVIERLSAESDLVILDMPPVLAVSDPAVLAPAMDGVLLVLRPGKTTLHAARQAIEQLRRVNARLIGVVLNGVKANGNSYSYYYHNEYPIKYYSGEKEEKRVKL